MGDEMPNSRLMMRNKKTFGKPMAVNNQFLQIREKMLRL
jgi:hypothetical protein